MCNVGNVCPRGFYLRGLDVIYFPLMRRRVFLRLPPTTCGLEWLEWLRVDRLCVLPRLGGSDGSGDFSGLIPTCARTSAA